MENRVYNMLFKKNTRSLHHLWQDTNRDCTTIEACRQQFVEERLAEINSHRSAQRMMDDILKQLLGEKRIPGDVQRFQEWMCFYPSEDAEQLLKNFCEREQEILEDQGNNNKLEPAAKLLPKE